MFKLGGDIMSKLNIHGLFGLCAFGIAAASVSVMAENLSFSKLALDGSNGTPVLITGVDVSSVKLADGGFELVLSASSSDLLTSLVDASDAAGEDTDVELASECDSAPSNVLCSDSVSLATRTTVDEVTLREGTTLASGLFVADALAPEFVVFDVRSLQALPPSIRVWVSDTPGGGVMESNGALQSSCESVVTSFSGRLRIAFDDSTQYLQDNACVVPRSSLVFINVDPGDTSSSFSLQRVFRLIGV